MKQILSSLATRLIALCCAALLWFYVVMEKTYESDFNIPVRLTNVPEKIAPASPFPDQAEVLVSGTGRQLLMLYFSSTELLINCERARRGEITFQLSAKNVELGGDIGAKVLFVKDPSQVTIAFDALVKKPLPVKPDISLSLADGRVLIGEPLLSPGTATLSGPRSHMSRIKHLKTQQVTVNGLSGDTSFLVFVDRPGFYGVSVEPNKVRVEIEVEAIQKRQFKDIPIRLIDVPPGIKATLNADRVSLVIAGAERDVREVKKANVNVFVRYAAFSVEQRDAVEPTVSIIGNVEWSNLEPPTVSLKKR